MGSIVFKTKVKNGHIELPDAKSFAGKEVKVTVEEIAVEKKTGEKTWKYLGALDLGGSLDDKNIRDLAND